MMDDTPPGKAELDSTAYAVLYCIREGTDTVRAINKATTLTKDQINGAFRRLDDSGYIAVDRPDGRKEEWIDGQRVTYQAPKEATLTDAGITYVDWATRHTAPPDVIRDGRDGDDLEDRLDQLEDDVAQLEKQFEQRFQQLREQVLAALDTAESD